MPADFLTLLRRDHADLAQELTRLLDPDASLEQLRMSLDGVRLGLTAHAEAEDIVLGKFEALAPLRPLVAQARGGHRAQESALTALVTTRLATPTWRERVAHLRALVELHAAHEEAYLVPALQAHPDYAGLAAAFATERLRQLVTLQPSGPVALAVG